MQDMAARSEDDRDNVRDGHAGEARPAPAVGSAGLPTAGARRLSRPFRSMGWLPPTALVLSLLGLADSVYVTILDLDSSIQPFCSSTGTVDCGAVLGSAESKLFGIIPVAYLGLVFFVLMLVMTSPWGWRSSRRRLFQTPLTVGWARLGLAVVGMIFVLWLLYAELFDIGHICLYCTGVHVITFLLFSLLVFDASFGAEHAVPARQR